MKRSFLIWLCVGLMLTLSSCSQPAPQHPGVSGQSEQQGQASVSEDRLESLPPADSQLNSGEESKQELENPDQQHQKPANDTEQPPVEHPAPVQENSSAQKPSSHPTPSTASSSSSLNWNTSKPSGSSPKPPVSSSPSTIPPVSSSPSVRPPVSSAPSSSTPSVPETPSRPSGNNAAARARQVFELVNQERRKAGLSDLTFHEELSANATVRAKEIVTKFDHTRPDGSKFSTAITIPYRTVGENIAWGQRTPEAVMEAWMNSSGHRANILNSSYTKIGVGVYESGGRLYWVQLFAG